MLRGTKESTIITSMKLKVGRRKKRRKGVKWAINWARTKALPSSWFGQKEMSIASSSVSISSDAIFATWNLLLPVVFVIRKFNLNKNMYAAMMYQTLSYLHYHQSLSELFRRNEKDRFSSSSFLLTMWQHINCDKIIWKNSGKVSTPYSLSQREVLNDKRFW